MDKKLVSVEMPFTVEFYDADSMAVVWHGNYVKYLEAVRCRLLDKIGYGYDVMQKEDFLFPVINLNIKYIRSLYFAENAIIKAHLVEYKDKLRIKYEIFNSKNEITTKAETTQMAVKWATKETQLESPPLFIQKVEDAIRNQ